MTTAEVVRFRLKRVTGIRGSLFLVKIRRTRKGLNGLSCDMRYKRRKSLLGEMVVFLIKRLTESSSSIVFNI